eukprot:2687795-Rhodomonas_salina.3
MTLACCGAGCGSAVNRDGTFDVVYDDGDRERRVAPEFMENAGPGPTFKALVQLGLWQTGVLAEAMQEDPDHLRCVLWLMRECCAAVDAVHPSRASVPETEVQERALAAVENVQTMVAEDAKRVEGLRRVDLHKGLSEEEQAMIKAVWQFDETDAAPGFIVGDLIEARCGNLPPVALASARTVEMVAVKVLHTRARECGVRCFECGYPRQCLRAWRNDGGFPWQVRRQAQILPWCDKTSYPE